MKPCFYRRYSFYGEERPTAVKSDDVVFALVSLFNRTHVETEQLIYPLPSLVAEFGGTLGLFIGFSFMAIWDGLEYIKHVSLLLKWI